MGPGVACVRGLASDRWCDPESKEPPRRRLRPAQDLDQALFMDPVERLAMHFEASGRRLRPSASSRQRVRPTADFIEVCRGHIQSKSQGDVAFCLDLCQDSPVEVEDCSPVPRRSARGDLELARYLQWEEAMEAERAAQSAAPRRRARRPEHDLRQRLQELSNVARRIGPLKLSLRSAFDRLNALVGRRTGRASPEEAVKLNLTSHGVEKRLVSAGTSRRRITSCSCNWISKLRSRRRLSWSICCIHYIPRVCLTLTSFRII